MISLPPNEDFFKHANFLTSFEFAPARGRLKRKKYTAINCANILPQGTSNALAEDPFNVISGSPIAEYLFVS